MTRALHSRRSTDRGVGCACARMRVHTHTHVFTHTHTRVYTHTHLPLLQYTHQLLAHVQNVRWGGEGGGNGGNTKGKTVQRDKSCKGKPVVILGFVHVYIDTTLAYEVHIVCDLPLVHAPCVTHDNARATMQQIKRMCQSVTIMQRSNGVWEEVGGT